MRRVAAQYALMILFALAGPMTARSETTTTTKAESASTATRTRAAAVDEKVTTGMAAVVASNLPLSRVITQVEDRSKIPVTVKGSAANTKVTAIIPKAKPVETVLRQIVESAPELVLKEAVIQKDTQVTSGYEIWKKKEYEEAESVVEVYQIKETSSRDMERYVSIVLSQLTDSVKSDDRLNKLIVRAVPEKQTEVKKLIAELDQKLTTQVFVLQHRKAQDIMVKLTQFFSLSQEDITFDDESGQVAVRGTSETLTRIGQLSEAFDVPAVQKNDSGTSMP
jgi:type II secretory pathway component GspD/PulD (secretin)